MALLMAKQVKNPPANAGTGSRPELGKSPGGGNGYSLQRSCLENPMDRGAWWTTVHRIAKESDMTEVTSANACTHISIHISPLS